MSQPIKSYVRYASAAEVAGLTKERRAISPKALADSGILDGLGGGATRFLEMFTNLSQSTDYTWDGAADVLLWAAPAGGVDVVFQLPAIADVPVGASAIIARPNGSTSGYIVFRAQPGELVNTNRQTYSNSGYASTWLMKSPGGIWVPLYQSGAWGYNAGP
jgi:hypothetical protein